MHKNLRKRLFERLVVTHSQTMFFVLFFFVKWQSLILHFLKMTHLLQLKNIETSEKFHLVFRSVNELSFTQLQRVLISQLSYFQSEKVQFEEILLKRSVGLSR